MNGFEAAALDFPPEKANQAMSETLAIHLFGERRVAQQAGLEGPSFFLVELPEKIVIYQAGLV